MNGLQLYVYILLNTNQYILSQASGLMKGVDDITIGMSGPADTLIIAANSNDAILLEQQAVSIKRIADSMLAIAQDAVQG